MSKLIDIERLRRFRQDNDERYYHKDEQVESAELADNFATERTIDDLDISCPPVTYGIAGGEAEIATGIQELTTLYGSADVRYKDIGGYADYFNGEHKAYAQKLLSRGKNQFSGFATDNDHRIDVIGGQEYKIFGLPSGFRITEYTKTMQTPSGGMSNRLVQNEGTFTLKEDTRYIRVYPNVAAEITESTKIMLYITFGESYNESYEEPRTDEIIFPDVNLFAIYDIRENNTELIGRDEAYSSGGGIRRIKGTAWTHNHTQEILRSSYNYSLNSSHIDIIYNYNSSEGFLPIPLKTQSTSFWGNILIYMNGSPIVFNKRGTIYVSEFRYNNKSYTLNVTLSKITSNSCTFNMSIEALQNIDMSDISVLEGILAYFESAELTFYYVVETPEEIPLSENPGWDSSIFVDNYGTLMFMYHINPASPEDYYEVIMPQAYEILYKVDLKEFVDSAYVATSGDASDIALKSELLEGDLVPALSSETKGIVPYSEESGPTQDTAFTYQTTAGGSDCGDTATLINLKGQTVKYEKHKQYGSAVSENSPDTMCLSVYIEDTAYNLEKGTMVYTATRPSYASNIDHKYLYIFKQIETNHSAFNVTDYTYTDPESGEEKTKHCGIFFKNKLAQKLPGQDSSFIGFILNGDEDLIFNLVTDDLSDGDIDFEENERMFILKEVYWFDLTDMFGLGKEPKSFDDFQKAFPNIIYNIDGFIHTKPYKLLNTGYNQNKEEYEEGNFEQNGSFILYSGTVSGFIRVLPNTKYGIFSDTNIEYVHFYKDNNPEHYNISYEEIDDVEGIFTTPTGCQYIRFSMAEGVENPEVAIYIYWDGSKQTYEPYKEWEYEFPNVTLRSVEDVCDELTPDGKLIRRVGYNHFQLQHPVELEPGSDKYYAKLLMSDLDWTEPHKIKFEHSSEYIIDSENNVIMIYVGDGQGLVGMSQSDIDEYYSPCVYELEEPSEETVTPFASELSIDDFGTMAFTNRDAESLEINIPQPCEIVYLADYVAFLDSVGYNSNYDADNIVYKTTPELSSLFDDKNFINMNGTIVEGTGTVHVLIHANSYLPGSGLADRISRDGNRIRMSPSAMYGTKKCNKLTPLYFTNRIHIIDLVEYLMEVDAISFEFDSSLSDIRDNCNYEFYKEIRNLLKDYKPDVYVSYIPLGEASYNSVWNWDTNDGNNDAYRNPNSLNGGFQRYTAQGLEDLYGITDPDEQAKRIPSYQIKHKKRLFKFVKNFEQATSESRWYGIMANVGIEFILISGIDWDNTGAFNIVGYRYIKLK